MAKRDTKDEENLIIKTALRLINNNELTMDKLAEQSGVARASIYRRYGGKDKIYRLISDKMDYLNNNSVDIKKKILKASRIIFGRKGFFRSTIEEIAVEASVGVATVYRYFKTKEKLIQSFKDEYTLGSMIGSMVIEEHTDLEESVYFIMYKGLEFTRNNRDLFRMSFFEGEEGLEYYRTSMDQTNRSIPVLTRHFEKLIKLEKIKNIDPVVMAYSLLGLIMGHGYIKSAYTGDHPDTLKEDARQITDIFLKGIKK